MGSEVSQPSPERLRVLFNYDPHTGVVTWRERNHRCGQMRAETWNAKFAGKPAGHINAEGYVAVRTNEIGSQKMHRVAWAIYFGEWPKDCIDHRNGDRKDNRIANLRQCTRTENNRNRKKSKSAIAKGVVATAYGTFRAKIIHNGSYKHLGTFQCVTAAILAYDAAAIRFHGDFANTNIAGAV